MAGNPKTNADYSILESFGGPIVRSSVGFLYRLGLVLVAGAMLLLPLIYLALVGAVASLVYHHAVYDWAPIMRLGGPPGSGAIRIARFLIYFIPLLAGIVVVFFLFKPLLARRPKQAQPLALNPSHNPLLYAFISKVCDVVGAPAPSRIDLDCQLNAAASFRRSFWSNDMVLTLGLPLVANLSAGELAGVIAHEFGHFTQGTAMRLSYVIRLVIRWFARVAYERDAWDAGLERWSREETNGWVALFVWAVQLAVWCSRLILKLLMLIGILVGGFMLRQMEYDADSYNIKVAGSEAFERTTRKLATLEAALAASQKQLVATWRKSRTLPDNLPEVLRTSHQQLPPRVLKKIDDTLGLRRTGFFDSHPSPADRIRRARQANDPGIFHDERPASELFASFEHPARFVTLLHYTDDLGIPITEQMLTHVEVKPAGGLPGKAASLVGVSNDSEAWVSGLLPFLLPLRLDPPAPSADPAADFSELSRLSAGLQPLKEQLEEFARQDAADSDKLAAADAAERALRNSVVLQPELLGPPGLTVSLASNRRNEALQSKEDLRHSLREILPVLKRRLELALSLALADMPGTEAEEPRRQIPELIAWLNQHADEYARRQELAAALAVQDKLNAVKAAQGECPALARTLEEQEAAVRSVAAGLDGPAESEAPQSKARLRVQLGKGVARGGGVSLVRQQQQEWLAQYHRKLDQLLQIAISMETMSA